MEKIKKLSNEVIDQIAAGEVVERPAHMVKELVENSIDAGATQVNIEISEGGRSVLVSDNGRGMPQDELVLALSRHATSKIDQADDLFKLASFGFRGEALASMASVSRLTLTSKHKSSDRSFRVQSEFGVFSPTEEVGSGKGTQVFIRDLFENVPARLKFLKSESAESSQVKQVCRAIALSHPEVGFRLKVKDKLVFYWPETETWIERVQQVLEVEQLFLTEGTYESVKCEIAFAPPHVVFGNSKNIWLFVQGRWVQEATIRAAVMEAYRGLLMHGEFPYAVVRIQCDPSEVDVNIHPAKSQVKFVNNKTVFRCVQRTLRAAMEEAPWVEKVVGVQKSTPVPEPQSSLKFSDSALEQTQFPRKPSFSQVQAPAQKYQASVVEPPKISMNQLTESSDNEPQWSAAQVIGQVDLTYVMIQTSQSMILVDQHAAHERVAYEKLMKRWKTGEGEVQQHLIPLAIDMEESEVEALMTCEDDLRKAGIEIERSGPGSIVVTASSTLLKEKSIVKALKKLAEEIERLGGSFAFENAVSDIFATMACHSVVRAGQALGPDQMKSLLVEMDEFRLSSFCPHGRPVFVEYPFSRIEKEFGRLV